MVQSRLLAALSLVIAFTATASANEAVIVTRWDFGTEEAAPLKPVGGVERDQAGPRPPEYPDFASTNTAVKFDGRGGRFEVADEGSGSRFDFTNGDAITVEAWVKLDNPREGSPMYVIGKGRTGNAQFTRDNQNWALRVVTSGGEAKISFLFATMPQAGSDHWHRWTSRTGFNATAGWHHVAVSYRFGTPESIRGWVDGIPVQGSWDMGGPTGEPPVVDDDAVWIGASLAGSPGNSFQGWLDAVAVHRGVLEDKVIASRYRRVGGPEKVGLLPEKMPDLGQIPAGLVLVTMAEGFPSHDRWLNEGETEPAETARWFGDEFLLPRIPLRYDSWGIRDSWKAPLLVRIAADVPLQPGTQSILLRARALGRLWIDGELVARTEPVTKQPPNGEEPITPLVNPPFPGLRVVGYHQQEILTKFNIPASSLSDNKLSGESPALRRVVLELVVGGKNLRTETGEVCVALQTADGTSFNVLRPQGAPLPLTDLAIEPVLEQIESSLQKFDDHNRRQTASTQDSFWEQRHKAARELVAQQVVPSVTLWDGKSHPVDAFLQAKIDAALKTAAEADPQKAEHFHNRVLPILRENCFRCHGEKVNGGLKLDSRESALKAGDSEVPAVVPGDPGSSEMISRILSDDEGLRMPPTAMGLNAEQKDILVNWVQDGAEWPAPPVTPHDVALSPLIGDEAFLRRVYLDTVGVPPSAEKVRQFLANSDTSKREQLIDNLLNDERLADHWVSYWLDLLAENPTLLNAALNSTGPFRWYLYDSLRDHKPFDRLVTELLMLRGSPHEGGSAGFGLAAENDSPFAAKGHIVASAFLGIDLQCARCHDSPYHSTKQRDLFSLAAMFDRKPVTVPATSRVPLAFFEQNKARESLIRVTLKPDEPVQPLWPFAETTGAVDGPEIDRLMLSPTDSRERLAALITAPQNRRFAQVVVNRLWKQLLGAGLVEPVHDWEGRAASHPELLDWLALEFVKNDYDVRHVLKLILTSKAYQREATGRNLTASPALRFFNAPDRRRLTAEQIVDSLYAATGSKMDVEELTFVHDGRRPVSNRLTLGRPTRAWMLTSLNNERDRPSLSLPKARTVVDVLEAFGWTGSRQKPVNDRETSPNLLQPGVLANGTLTMTLSRASLGSTLSQLAVEAKSAESLVDELFLRVLLRHPTPSEQVRYTAALQHGFETRLLSPETIQAPTPFAPLPLVTWFNHLQPEANAIQQELERRVRLGPAPDPRLEFQWREIYEDVVWSLINHREFVWIP